MVEPTARVETRSYSQYTRGFDRYGWRHMRRLSYAEWAKIWANWTDD